MWLNGMSLAASSHNSGNTESKYFKYLSPDTISNKDTLNNNKDSLNLRPDTLNQAKDTTHVNPRKKSNKTKIEAPVIYASEDSFAFNLDDKKILLYDKATVNYQNIDLKAQFVQFDMTKQIVFASGLPDSSGKIVGLPNFKQGNEVFDAQTLNYNFKTKKGYIEAIKSNRTEGFCMLNKQNEWPMAISILKMENILPVMRIILISTWPLPKVFQFQMTK